VVSLVDNVYTWFYQLFDIAGNSFNSQNYTATIDTTYPLISYGVGTLVNGTSVDSDSIYVNVSAYDLNEANITFELFNSTSLLNRTIYSSSLRSINYTNLTGGTYNYNVTLTDRAGNINHTETRVILIGLLSPNVNNFTYYPNSSALLDPGANVSFNVVITKKSPVALSIAVLEYYNGTNWNNMSLTNIGGNNYQANITLSNTPTNYTYRYYVIDAVGNLNQTSNLTLESVWDCTWVMTPSSLGGFSGFNERKYLGLLSLNNTGDIEFENNNCSIDLRFSYDLSEGRIYIDNSYFKPSNVYTLAADNNLTVKVNASFLSTVNSELVNIFASDLNNISNSFVKNTTATLITTTGNQPYLFEAFDNVPLSLPLSVQTLELSSYLRNLVGDGSLAKAAYNVSFNWTLPSSFSILNGNPNLNYTIILDSNPYYNRLNITFDSSNLPSMRPGVYNLSIFAQGFNSSGNLISMFGNITLLREEVNITFSCSSTPDGVVVSACGSLDGDYSAPTVTPTVISTGGGGGGAAGGGGGGGAIVYSKIISIVRGQSDSFTIDVTNNYNSRLENLVLTLLGFQEQYIKFSPNIIESIEPGETKSFTVMVSSPKYSDYEEYRIQAIVNGDKVDGSVRTPYIQTENIKLIIQEIAANQTQVNLAEAEKAIEDMLKAGFNVDLVNSLLDQAKNKLKELKNKEAFDLAAQIIELKDKAFNSKSLILSVFDALNDPRKNLLVTGYAPGDIALLEENFSQMNFTYSFFSIKNLFRSKSAEDMLQLAIAAFQRGDYELAEQRANTAKALLILERKGNFALFIYLYWHYILISLIVLVFLLIFGYRIFQKKSINSRINELDKEESSIKNLVSASQEKYFAGKIGAHEYHDKMQQLNNSLVEIKNKRINLRNKRIKLLKPEIVSKELENEKNQIENEIAKAQRDYYQDKKITETTYKEEFKILNERLAEIEDERLTIDLMKSSKEEKLLKKDGLIKIKRKKI
jgi:uncharacterized membrane protein